MFQDQAIPYEDNPSRIASFMNQVFSWMSGALFISGLVAWKIGMNPALLQKMVVDQPGIFYGLLIGEVVLVLFLSYMLPRLSMGAAILGFLAYAAMNGATLAVIFAVYTSASIMQTFMVCAGMFAAVSAYGYFTKSSLAGWGGFLYLSLFGIIIASLVNLFFQNPMILWITTYAGIIVFAGLAAYDTQKIKAYALMANDYEGLSKAAILGALTLYLDFINLFLHLLRVMGKRR